MDVITRNYAICNTEGIIGNIFVAEPDNPIIAIVNGVEVPEDEGYMIGDAYIDGEFVRIASKPPSEKTPAELRKLAYETEPIIAWEGGLITISAAAMLWTYYAAEDSINAATLTALITDAKTAIRERYPDA